MLAGPRRWHSPAPLLDLFDPNLVRVSVSLLRIVTAHQIIILRGRYPVHL